jgi:hypothetical protein
MVSLPGQLRIAAAAARTARAFWEWRLRSIVMRSMQSLGKVRLDDGKHNIFRSSARRRSAPTPVHKVLRRFTLARNARPGQYQAEIGGYLGMPLNRHSGSMDKAS